MLSFPGKKWVSLYGDISRSHTYLFTYNIQCFGCGFFPVPAWIYRGLWIYPILRKLSVEHGKVIA